MVAASSGGLVFAAKERQFKKIVSLHQVAHAAARNKECAEGKQRTTDDLIEAQAAREARKGVKAPPHPRRRGKAAAAAEQESKPPPKALFDAAATLGIVVSMARDHAADRAEAQQAQLEEEQPQHTGSTSGEALAALVASHDALTAKLGSAQRALGQAEGRGAELALLGGAQREPETRGELENEIGWIAHKVKECRGEARAAEAAVRAHAKQRGRELTPADLAADERVRVSRARAGSLMEGGRLECDRT